MAALALTRWPGVMPLNFSAAYALAFCAGVYFQGKWRWILPLGSLLVSDVALNLYYGAPIVDVYIAVKLATFAAVVWLGTRFSPRQSLGALVGGGLTGAVLFYFVTNIASWIFDPAYPKTLGGLIQALTVGTPGWPHTWEFFRNTFLSGGLFTGLFAGVMKLSEKAASQEEEEPAADEEKAPAGSAPEEAGA